MTRIYQWRVVTAVVLTIIWSAQLVPKMSPVFESSKKTTRIGPGSLCGVSRKETHSSWSQGHGFCRLQTGNALPICQTFQLLGRGNGSSFFFGFPVRNGLKVFAEWCKYLPTCLKTNPCWERLFIPIYPKLTKDIFRKVSNHQLV